jgi:hypothetical protein
VDPRLEADRIERLLEQLRTMTGPQAWRQVEELLQRVTSLYGAGLASLMALLSKASDASAHERAVVEDELLSSLLLLHGLHPTPPLERIRDMLARMEPALPRHRVELLGADEAGCVRLRLNRGDAPPAALLKALEEAAPDATLVWEKPPAELVPLKVRGAPAP